MIDVTAIHNAPLSPLDLAERLGLDVGRYSRTDRALVSCPWHSPDHHPSCVVSLRDGRIVAYCHACREGGDVLALVAAARGLDVRSQFREVAVATAALVGVTVDADAAPPKQQPTPVLLATRIDRMADDWIRGRQVLPDARIEANDEHIHEAMMLLCDADAIDREAIAQRDAELERLAAEYPTDDRTEH